MPNLSDYLLPDGRYYFDNAATTKMSKEALRVYNEASERWFMNPMSYKDFNPEIENLLINARNHVADFVGGDPYNDKVIFTSGATESINLLLKGYFFANLQEKRKIITSPIEHKAVLETCKYLESIGAELEYVNITSEGVVDYDHLESIVDGDTLFVCLMHVNNETGEISDLERIYDIAHSAGSKFFTDTTQSITKLEVDAQYFDACVGSGHKFHGPKGVGFLFSKGDLNLSVIQHGGGQEGGLRAGTHNLPGIMSMISNLDCLADGDGTQALWKYITKTYFNQYERVGSQVSPYIGAFIIDDPDEFERSNKTKIVYSNGSACNGGLIYQSHVAKHLYLKKKLIRISL
jgi:cysteine desulfurase